MKLLSVSTAENGCSMAVMDNDTLICEEYWTSRKTHSKRIMGMIRHLLEDRAQTNLEDLDGFVAAKGPGSFTGLRIGISVIKGLALAVEKPAYGVSSLDAIAFRFFYSTLPVCVMMDARRDQVYAATYQFKNGRLAWKTKSVVDMPEKALSEHEGPVLFAGSGARVYQDRLQKIYKDALFAGPDFEFVSARSMVKVLYNTPDFQNSKTHWLTPEYIRKSDAELAFGQ